MSLAGGFGGTTSNGLAFDMLVMDDGTYWVFYGTPPDSGLPLQSAAFIQGTSTIDTTAQSFTTSDGYDYGSASALTGVGTYTASSISGTYTYPTTSFTFSGTPLATTVYDYTATPTLSALNGTWDMQSLVGPGTSITVTTDVNGATTFRGVNGASCNFIGTFTVDASGKNVFDVDITFQGAPCAQGTNEYKGVAILTSVGGSPQLMLAAADTVNKLGITSTGVVQTAGGGGGGGNENVAGAFGGTIDTPPRKFEMLMLADGSYWVMYGATGANALDVTGFIEGTSTQDTTDQTFSSSDALDFGTSTLPATVSGSITSSAIDGEIFYGANSHTQFGGTPLDTSMYNYLGTPDATALAGTWNMASLAGVGSQIVVTATDANTATFTGSTALHCAFQGTFTAHTGENVFDSDITFTSGACSAGLGEFKGIAILTDVNSATQLVVTGISADRTLGIAATGNPGP